MTAAGSLYLLNEGLGTFFLGVGLAALLPTSPAREARQRALDAPLLDQRLELIDALLAGIDLSKSTL